ncbi:hypothetical protein [Curtobacterium oceanosedimentum]|uniref:hypothetical protein n=1 Tax=Curtobacterium oceanosedimentum TaxID=465820 RepID=UPI00339B8687
MATSQNTSTDTPIDPKAAATSNPPTNAAALHPEETTAEPINHELIARLDDWVKDNYDQLVADGVKTWDDVKKLAEEAHDRALHEFARHRLNGGAHAADGEQSSTPAA